METNRLFYGDNLDILRNREYFPDHCVDLIYLDPPFNSNRDYNVLFADESGFESQAQIMAFEDTWHWNYATQRTFEDIVQNAPEKVVRTMDSLKTMLGVNQMSAYLVMMTARLIELHRVLKPTGSLYLHCDPTASHYLKIILDSIFGAEHFRNEIIWQRTSSHNDAKKWGAVHDTIFYYTRGSQFVWNPSYSGYNPDYIARFYRHQDERGRYRHDHIIRSASMGERPNLTYEYKGFTPPYGWRVVQEKLAALDHDNRIYWSKSGRPYLKRYLDEQSGTAIKTVITDIPPVGAQAKERMGYPTQKPLALLERIIAASSNAGDIVLDPFCGCGTAIAASQKLGRRWLGIDITHLAIALQRYRMEDMFPGVPFQIVGEPTDVGGARALAQQDRYQFQWWALSLVRAKPINGETTASKKGKKGKDRGVDGVINFLETGNKVRRVVIQVKSGKVGSSDIRDLRGALERENAQIGVLITLEPPTRDMIAEASSAGQYSAAGWGRDFPRLQILTIEDLLAGKRIEMPYGQSMFKKAPRENGPYGTDPLPLLY